MSVVVLLLGADLGQAAQTFKQATESINQTIGAVTQKSSLYISPPWGFESDTVFTNQVLIIETELLPEELLRETQVIEIELGRTAKTQTNSYESRFIDIDILFYDQLVMSTSNLIIPHPKIPERRFTLLPLFELIPNFVHPEHNKTIAELTEQCSDPSEVNLI
ncbi:MAG: 2-amino-4-hydroxy-6-hydroxymethyldihydropteridine diphosphokinase [Bacteroidales bacterium]|nr:2-amino-4-hydroxy-6-hydroxymethyldihydropteridine diphosphokinase [Bacteroidales bacterium]